jgi:hypothetical protein
MKSCTRTFLLLIAITCAYNCYSQAQPIDAMKNSFRELLLEDKWVTDHILGLDPKIKTYKLTKFNTKGKFAGNITQFSDRSTFHSAYTAWCGNDYFTDVSGKFNFLDNDKIAITVETVTCSGEWTKPAEHRETQYLTFKISITDDTIILTMKK